MKTMKKKPVGGGKVVSKSQRNKSRSATGARTMKKNRA